MIVALILSAALSVMAWAAVITGPCILLGHVIARALVRLVRGKEK